jgi:probable phosphomutase (TIGR03848 family)
MAEQITRVLLIRHATNDWITSGKLPCRTAGVHLNERGRSEAEALAERVASLPIKAIYSSPLERAMETAQAVATRLNLPVQVVDGVQETDCGEWQGQVIEELAKTDLWRVIQSYPSGFRFPGGETFTNIQARMATAIDGLRAAHPGQLIAVFSHADPIKVAIAYYAGIPLDLFQRLSISPAAISEFAFSTYGPSPRRRQELRLKARARQTARTRLRQEPKPRPVASQRLRASQRPTASQRLPDGL